MQADFSTLATFFFFYCCRYDAEEYRKDLEGFIASEDDEAMAGQDDGISLPAIHTRLEHERDAKMVNRLINKFGIVAGDQEDLVYRLHKEGNSKGRKHPDDAANSQSQTRNALVKFEFDEESKQRIKRLADLGFTRVRTIQPADGEFLFPEERDTIQGGTARDKGGKAERAPDGPLPFEQDYELGCTSDLEFDETVDSIEGQRAKHAQAVSSSTMDIPGSELSTKVLDLASNDRASNRASVRKDLFSMMMEKQGKQQEQASRQAPLNNQMRQKKL